MILKRREVVVAALIASIGAGTASADKILIEVIFENLAPRRGTWQTPLWVGFHNGSFDYFNLGEPASKALERIAEDGTIDPLDALFQGSGHGSVSGAIGGGPIAPGAVVRGEFTINTDNPRSRYFSFASMVIPSNDAFIGNDDGMLYQIVNDNGVFVGVDFFIAGREVLDAGAEVNDEIPKNTAFFGQQNPNTGEDENGVVHEHAGYLGSFGNPGEEPRILADPMFRGADFTLPDYPIGRLTVRIVPSPGALAVFAGSGLVFGRRRRR